MPDEPWTCGHTAGAMCAECYRELAAKAHELAEENLALRQKHEDMMRKLDEFESGALEELKELALLREHIKGLRRQFDA